MKILVTIGAVDDEHSDTDDEDQHVEYHEYHSSVHSITVTNRQLWWPCTWNRLRHRTIWEQLYDDQGNPDLTFPSSLQSHRERLFEMLWWVKLQKKSGLLPVLVDSGWTCVITPYLWKLILRIPNKTIISGVETGSVSFSSAIIFTAVVTTGEYEMFSFPTGYFMMDLDFVIMSCAHLEKTGYEFTSSWVYHCQEQKLQLVSWCLLYVMFKQVSISWLITSFQRRDWGWSTILQRSSNVLETQVRLMIFLHRLTLRRVLLNQILQTHLQHLFSQTWGERWNHSRGMKKNLEVHKTSD